MVTARAYVTAGLFAEAILLLEPDGKASNHPDEVQLAGDIYRAIEMYPLAENRLAKALVLLQQCDDLEGEAQTRLALGPVYARLNKKELAREHLQKAREIFLSLGNTQAEKAGLAHRVRFEVATAKDYPGRDFDLVTVFDALHDMGDPVGASAHVRQSLKPGGRWMIVEPFAGDRLEDNLNPVGRIFYSASTFICTPASRSQEGAMCLGAQAGEARMRAVVTQGGFSGFRRAAQTPFNLIYEACP